MINRHIFARIHENLRSLYFYCAKNAIILRIIRVQILQKSMEQVLHALGISAIVSMGNPLELVKSRIQTSYELVDRGAIQKCYKGFTDCIKTIKVNQGIKALWKGNSISLMRFFPNEKINNDVKNYAHNWLPKHALSNFLAGVTGGWVAAGIFYPIDTLRLFMGTSEKRSIQTVKELGRKCVNEGGKFLFQGYRASLLNIALFRGTYFGMFDTLKKHSSNETEKWMSAYVSGLAGGMIVYPTETLRKKKVLSCRTLSYSEIIRRTVTREGLKGFFRGCSLTPLQSLQGAAVLMYFDASRQQKF